MADSGSNSGSDGRESDSRRSEDGSRHGEREAGERATDGSAKREQFVADTFKHKKLIDALGEGVELLREVGLPEIDVSVDGDDSSRIEASSRTPRPIIWTRSSTHSQVR